MSETAVLPKLTIAQRREIVRQEFQKNARIMTPKKLAACRRNAAKMRRLKKQKAKLRASKAND